MTAGADTERARLQAVLESMTDAVVVLSRDRSVQVANAAYLALNADVPDGRMDDEGGHPIPPDESLEGRAARGEEFRTVVTRAAPGEGRRWYEAVSRRVHGGDPASTVLVIRDITDRSLRRIQDEFIANASHELRTPLAVLTGYLHLIERASDPGVDVHVRKALEHAEELDRLVADLFDITRLETGQMRFELEPIDLGELVQHAVEAAGVLADAQCVRYVRPVRSVLVDADRTRMLQVMRNLLDNARVHAPSSEVRVALRRHGGRAELTVADDGPGIAARDAVTIFDRFQQASPTTQPGLGLGLHIARAIVHGHHGTLSVASTPGRGTRFTMRLPLLAERRIPALRATAGRAGRQRAVVGARRAAGSGGGSRDQPGTPTAGAGRR